MNYCRAKISLNKPTVLEVEHEMERKERKVKRNKTYKLFPFPHMVHTDRQTSHSNLWATMFKLHVKCVFM